MLKSKTTTRSTTRISSQETSESKPTRSKVRRKKTPEAEKETVGAPSSSPASRENALAIANLGLDKKALQVCVIDVRGLSSYADYLVIMTAESGPQMRAIVEHVEVKMKEKGERPLGVEGVDAGQWLLIDYGDVVAHVFDQETRVLYGLESLWAEAPRIAVEQ